MRNDYMGLTEFLIEKNSIERRNSRLSVELVEVCLSFMMSELLSIKQEPELDIVSDGEGDSLSRFSTDDDGTVVNNDENKLKVTNSYCF